MTDRTRGEIEMAAQSGQVMKIYPAAADDPDIQNWGSGAGLNAGPFWNAGPVARPAHPQYVIVAASSREAELIAEMKALSAEVCRIARVVDDIREQLAPPVLVARDVSTQDAKAEVGAYLQREGRAFPSDISEALTLDYDMVVEALDELRRDGLIELEAVDGASDAS
jgi:hypothetical protein